LPEASERNEGKILIDGNSAAAAGLLAGGCTFMSWYPITPSSSIAENFMQYSYKFGKKEGKNTRAIVQAEDELSAISMVLGAGWAGSRAITCTSGPGVSLMAEAAGLSYFAEVPAVIWDVQRCGPSTGLPTRTQQGDITSAIFLSHGDTQHVVLIPGSPCECFEFGQTCFDLAERLQTLVVVLSDLDLGMNSWTCPSLKLENKPFDRGKVKTANDLQEGFGRFVDSDNDGIAPRTLPGTPSDYAAYFSRGTAHDDFAKYSEDADNYQRLMNRLQRKFETAKTLVPKPIIEKSSMNSGKVISIVTYGTSDSIKSELKELLAQKNIHINYMRLRAFPFSKEVENFINVDHEVFVVEQNLQGQMFKILRTECCFNQNLKSIAFSNGLPLDARKICEKILAALEINNELQ
ncbi:MAG: hypothetical protein KDD50_04645, partial [Bdellovibrionales bacterium]|nr:hypothetical protein [Bdellovibrionales bacterium]